MTRVVAFATTPPRASAVQPHLAEIAAAGGEVRLACWFEPTASLYEAGVVEARQVGQAAVPRISRRRLSWLRRNRSDAPPTADRATERWLQVRNDPWVSEQVAPAQALVALDQDAVYPVWELARANPGVKASFGLYAVSADLAGRLRLSDGRAVDG
ncbi:MAG: hypothetical protein ACRDWI_05435 [Jiangellaceae bacterium]